MKYCVKGQESSFYWESLNFKLKFPSMIVKPPQLLVADYPSGFSIMFEIAKSAPIRGVAEVFVLSGSAINLKTGFHLVDIQAQGIVTARTEFIRLPTLEEIEFYEKHSRL